MSEALSVLEREIAAKLAARASAMERDLADFVAIPTCSGHEEGLVRFRAIMRAYSGGYSLAGIHGLHESRAESIAAALGGHG